jgi:peroxiredoxin
MGDHKEVEKETLSNILKWVRMRFGKMVVVFLLLSFGTPILAASAPSLPPAKGGKLPVISLPIPKNPTERTYLGLSGEGNFKISRIKAQAVLIKIFNLYCPICQSTASAMAELYDQIENHPNLKDKIKLIGIGVGNSLLEVEIFKQNNRIPFPIFPDEDFRIHKTLGEVRTPFFIAIRMERDGSPEIVHTHLGGLTEPGAFLDLMLEAYGIHQEEILKKEEIATSDNEPIFIKR